MFREILHTLACLSVLNGSSHSLHLGGYGNSDDSSSSSSSGSSSSSSSSSGSRSSSSSDSDEHRSSSLSIADHDGAVDYANSAGSSRLKDFADVAQMERERLMLLAAEGRRHGGQRAGHPFVTGSIHMNAAANAANADNGGHRTSGAVNYVPSTSRRIYLEGIPSNYDTRMEEHLFPHNFERIIYSGTDNFGAINPHQQQQQQHPWIPEAAAAAAAAAKDTNGVTAADDDIIAGNLFNYPILGNPHRIDPSRAEFYGNALPPHRVDANDDDDSAMAAAAAVAAAYHYYQKTTPPQALQDLFDDHRPRQIMHIDDMFPLAKPNFDIRIQQKMQRKNLHQLQQWQQWQQLHNHELQTNQPKPRLIHYGHEHVAPAQSATTPAMSSSSTPSADPSSGVKSPSPSPSSSPSIDAEIDVKSNQLRNHKQLRQQQQQRQQQKMIQSNNKRSTNGGGNSIGIGSPGQPPTHSIASQLMLRSSRGQRQYDVPQIECPPSVDGMQRFACPTPDLQGRYRCVDDHVLCDGFIDCPEGEDEDRRFCMFHKASNAREDILADALLRWARGR